MDTSVGDAVQDARMREHQYAMDRERDIDSLQKKLADRTERLMRTEDALRRTKAFMYVLIIILSVGIAVLYF